MYSTLLITLLATTPLAPAQYYGAYGNYGYGYGGYGAYGAYSGGGFMLPYYVYPYIGQVEDTKANEEKEAAEKKFNDLQDSYGKMEQRLIGLERLLATMEPYLKAQETVHDERYRALDSKLEERIRSLEKIQAFAGLESQVTVGLAKLEERLQNFEAKLRSNDSIPDALLTKLDSLGQTNLNIESRLLKLETTGPGVAATGSNDQVKSMISGVEEKLGLGLTLLEDRLKQMEDRLHKQGAANTSALPIVTGANADSINQLARSIDERFVLLEKKLQMNDDFASKVRGHEQQVLDSRIKENFLQLRETLQPKKTGAQDDANRRVNRAVVIITLPADARLFINGMESTIGSNLRTFVTPELEQTKHYYYTIKVELTRNGQVVTDTQRVYFQRGEEVRVTFDHLENGVGPALPPAKNG